MVPLILLIATFSILQLLNHVVLKKRFGHSFIGRVALALMLIFTAVAHFTRTEEMIAMLPDMIPYKEEAVYGTGIIEIAAALGLLFKRTSRLTSILLVLFFLCILPANISGTVKRVALGGMEYGPVYLFFRIPLQLFFIGWVYYFGLRINHKAN